MGRPRINPRTPEEWQEAVNAAHFAIGLDAAVQYGLLVVEGQPPGCSGIKVERCQRLLKAGEKMGIRPIEDDQA